MKLDIEWTKKKVRNMNSFKLIITFMHGDGDGYDTHEIKFTEDEYSYNSFKAQLEEFLKPIKICIDKDRKGRGGFDSTMELIEEYSRIKGWAKYCLNVLENTDIEDNIALEQLGLTKVWCLEGYEKSPFMYYIPTHGGWFCSYYSMKMYYYDNNGDEFPVKMTLFS